MCITGVLWTCERLRGSAGCFGFFVGVVPWIHRGPWGLLGTAGGFCDYIEDFYGFVGGLGCFCGAVRGSVIL